MEINVFYALTTYSSEYTYQPDTYEPNQTNYSVYLTSEIQ